MNTLGTLTLSTLMLTLLPVLPVTADGFRDQARVIASTPIYERFNEPRRECWSELVGYERVRGDKREYGGAILGGIVGGLAGSAIGKGSGRTLAAAVGAATGAITGDRMGNGGRAPYAYSRPIHEERCSVTDSWSQRLTGYDVVYRYQGRDYTAFLPYDPGPTVKVRVDVNLAED
ncbi:MAG TPA: glycine zipper 2TM domain-containing protein [Thiobacillaceae bacterium]|nr:glycine zipper 2TM domain-containing protein [Thiobacillaceae bacterium]HNU63429.1 glycine zipper 2TM domain-containing protein [Thiobacillaceae bacterium]